MNKNNIRADLIDTSKLHFKAHIERHRINIEVMLANPIAIPEHTDIMEAVEAELAKMAEYQDKLEMLLKYF
jgi:hypothetical protein